MIAVNRLQQHRNADTRTCGNRSGLPLSPALQVCRGSLLTHRTLAYRCG
jgi:hypothetical protein